MTSTTCSTGIACTASTALRVTTTQPFSLRVTTASLASLRSAFDRGVEVGGLIEAVQLVLVGENDVDGALLMRSRNSAR